MSRHPQFCAPGLLYCRSHFLSLEPDTKITGDLKKGSRVTVQYKMTASSVEVKDAGKAKSDAKTKAK